MVELYEPVAEEQGFALHLDSMPGIMIRGDRHLLSQAIANLLDNALKYGGSDIAIRVRQQDARAVIEVADRGPGIPEAERENVFDRFVRLEPSRSTPGNGLGLSLVRAVARRHDGGRNARRESARNGLPRPQGPHRIPGMPRDGLAIVAVGVAAMADLVDPAGGFDHHGAKARPVEAGAAQYRRPSSRRRADLRGSAHSGSILCVQP